MVICIEFKLHHIFTLTKFKDVRFLLKIYTVNRNKVKKYTYKELKIFFILIVLI